VDVRLIAATHRDLPAAIESGQFREDLYYRLSVFPIDIAPLRERPSDIPPLVEEFIHRMHREQSVSLQMSDAAMQVLQEYTWSGNVRELANLIERLVVIKPNGRVEASDLPWPIAEKAAALADKPHIVGAKLAPITSAGIDLKQTLATIERDMIYQALATANGVIQHAAKLLGVGRTTLVEKIKRFEIDVTTPPAKR